MLVVWSYLAVAAKHTRLPSPVVFGLGHAFCLQLPRVLGMLFRPVFNGIDEGTSSLIGAIAVFATIATVMCFGLRRYFASGKENARRSTGLADSSPQAPSSESASENESIFGGFGLTRRETEVAGFLRSAYSLPEIASRLYISHETVRTHVKNIYAKAGVRSRQEFLVLLEEKGAKR